MVGARTAARRSSRDPARAQALDRTPLTASPDCCGRSASRLTRASSGSVSTALNVSLAATERLGIRASPNARPAGACAAAGTRHVASGALAADDLAALLGHVLIQAAGNFDEQTGQQ